MYFTYRHVVNAYFDAASQPPSQSSMIDTPPSHLLEQGDMESRSQPVEHHTSKEMKSLLEDINYGSQPQNHGPSMTASQPPSQSSMIDTLPSHLLEQGDMESRSQPVEHQTSEEMESLLEDINYGSQPQNQTLLPQQLHSLLLKVP